MTNTFAYRLPHSGCVVRGASSTLVKGFGANGFVVAPFADSATGCFTIPAEDGCTKIPFMPDIYEIPSHSTSEASHAKGINLILECIERRELKKCVLAKVLVKEADIDIEATFTALCSARPDAFVFCFHTPQTGTWIGASPELLLRSKNGRLQTMSLAGTREAGTQGGWGEKDLNEQQIVTDFIADKFHACGFNTEVGERITLKAGNVEHLMTPIEAECSDNGDVQKLLFSLSPTPALCGEPRSLAMHILTEAEQFRRGYYGGFCGPVTDRGRNFDLYVNLRSMCVRNKRYCIFAGGGIVEGSSAQNEWQETEKKAKTILQNIRTH